MTLAEYKSITGLTVATADETRVTAQITRVQRILEDILGYTLTAASVNTNQYVEIGKTADECPCPDVDMDTLKAPDAVVKAYRLFNYNRKDKMISIDPNSKVHKVKLVKDGVTFKTFETDEYRLHYKHNFIKYIEECDNCCWCSCVYDCYCTQLAIDADWLWTATLPNDLLQVFADMVTYYADLQNNIKSETLGSHSYTKFDKSLPQMESYNWKILQKYIGANGSGRRISTV
jgi:hypothetical protein